MSATINMPLHLWKACSLPGAVGMGRALLGVTVSAGGRSLAWGATYTRMSVTRCTRGLKEQEDV